MVENDTHGDTEKGVGVSLSHLTKLSCLYRKYISLLAGMVLFWVTFKKDRHKTNTSTNPLAKSLLFLASR